MNAGRMLSRRILRQIEKRIISVPFFFRAICQFARLRVYSCPRFSLNFRDLQLCLFDSTESTGFDRHYVYHTAWASRILAEQKPHLHIDIGSSLYFVSNASAFVSMEFYDYRPASLNLSNLDCGQADLYSLPFLTDSFHSLSCMHVIEHVGLGRYGDRVDYDGDLIALEELKRVVAPGGDLLLVMPVGGQARIKFNAHRIYTYRQIITIMSGFRLKEFALVPDDDSEGGLVRYASEAQSDSQRYGCGCFWFVKSAD